MTEWSNSGAKVLKYFIFTHHVLVLLVSPTHVSNEPDAYFLAHLAPKTREKHSLTYRPFNFLKHPPSAS